MKFWSKITLLFLLFLVFPVFLSLFRAEASAGECLDADIKDISQSDDLVTYSGNENVSGICIKSGSNMFGDKHSGVLTESKIYENGCYEITGLGSKNIAVKRLKDSKECQGISHIDLYTKPPVTPTPVPTGAPFPSPSATPTQGAKDKKDHKILICHIPPGNPENAHVISIDKNAWEEGHNPHNAHDMDFAVSSYDADCPVKKPNPAPVAAQPSVTQTPSENIQPTQPPSENVQPTQTPVPTASPVPGGNVNPTSTPAPTPTGQVLGGKLPETGNYENNLFFAGALLVLIGSRGYVTSNPKTKKKK